MKHADMPETFKTVLKEMCKRVKAPYTKIDFNTPEWYTNYCWSEEKQESFIEWMTDYLHNNAQAQREILNNPSKSKERIRSAVKEFVFNYGWKICEKKK